ncbi:MAG: RDD family protein [Acidimicrobiales bacterium]
MTFYPAASVPSVPAGDPTAVVGKRIGAAIIDVLITVGVVILMFLINHDTVNSNGAFGISCSDVRDAGGTNLCVEAGDNLWYAEGGKARLIYGVAILAGLANHVLLQGATGASIGKKAVGLRVIKKDTGQLASFGPNALRWLVSLFDIGCCFLIALIMIITTKGHRRLGDMAANTLVVDTNSVGTPPVVPGLTSPQLGGPYATAYPPAGSPFTPPQAASPTGWPPPTTSTPPPPAAPAPVADAAPAANTPTWDQQRNTYVIFDSAQNQWMQWDATSQQWRPIS